MEHYDRNACNTIMELKKHIFSAYLQSKYFYYTKEVNYRITEEQQNGDKF